jgi:hypothetical protein
MPDVDELYDADDERIWAEMGAATARRFRDHFRCTCGQLPEKYMAGWFTEAIAAAVISDRLERSG